MPMDALYLDEVDLCNPDHVGTAINRLDASNWKLVTYLSTPTLPNTGIDAAFQNSDQSEWVVRCRTAITADHGLGSASALKWPVQ